MSFGRDKSVSVPAPFGANNDRLPADGNFRHLSIAAGNLHPKEHNIMSTVAPTPIQKLRRSKAREALAKAETRLAEIQMKDYPVEVKKRLLSEAWQERAKAIAKLQREEIPQAGVPKAMTKVF